MNTDKSGNGNGRIEALKQREREIRARLAVEQVRLARRRKKDEERLFAQVGRAVVQLAERSPDFHLMLKQTLGSVVTDEKARRFLTEKGWL